MLMQRADVAMYQAKEGRTGVERYVRELDGNSVQRLALAGDLRTALEREEFVLHYQPKVDLRTNAVIGRRGAAALGAPRARLAAARRVHPAGRAHRPDRAADQLRARPRAAPDGRVARAGPRHRRRGQPLGAHADRARPARPHRGHVPALGGAHEPPRARDHREHGRGRPGPRAADPRAAARARRRDLGRRLRDRLLVDGLPQAAARSRRSRSTARSSRRWRPTRATRRSCAARSTSRAASGCASSPRASRRPTCARA